MADGLEKNELAMVKHLHSILHRAMRRLVRLTRPLVSSIDERFRSITASSRALPDTLIIGVMKGGTTSVYEYLIQHPQMHGAKEKEVRFFDRYFYRGINWYRSRFPLSLRVTKFGDRVLEASPGYIFEPGAMTRIAATLNSPKILVVLRDPIERAYSHYRHEVRAGRESETFPIACRAFLDQIAEEREHCWESPVTSGELSFAFKRFSYCEKGRYGTQLREVAGLIPSSDLKIIISEELFKNPLKVMKEVEEFLGLEGFRDYRFEIFNPGDSKSDWRDGESPEFLKYLQDFYSDETRILSDEFGLDTSLWRGGIK